MVLINIIKKSLKNLYLKIVLPTVGQVLNRANQAYLGEALRKFSK